MLGKDAKSQHAEVGDIWAHIYSDELMKAGSLTWVAAAVQELWRRRVYRPTGQAAGAGRGRTSEQGLTGSDPGSWEEV